MRCNVLNHLNNTWLKDTFMILDWFSSCFSLVGNKAQPYVLQRSCNPFFSGEIKLSDIKSNGMCYFLFNTLGSGLRSRPLRFISWVCNQPFLWTSTSQLSLCFNFLILRETELQRETWQDVNRESLERKSPFFLIFVCLFVSEIVDGLFYIFNVIVILNEQCKIEQFNELKCFLLAICVIYKLWNRKHSDQ